MAKTDEQLRKLNDELIERLEKEQEKRGFAIKTNQQLIKQREEVQKENLQLKVRVAQLEGLINELADEKDNMTAACEDLEDEVARYKKQIAEYQQPKDTREEQENILLRQLLKVVL